MNLDYDSTIFAGMDFKHTLFVRVSDEGIPVLLSKKLLIQYMKIVWIK